jgi:hypothetical protein
MWTIISTVHNAWEDEVYKAAIPLLFQRPPLISAPRPDKSLA